jgi:integrase/recombinase XerD
MQSQDPASMACCQEILAIPAKKHDRPAVAHLTVSQTRQLLTLPDRSTRTGRRDATLLATLYDTAARVQELADLVVRDIRLDAPAMAALTGKGRKTRHVPLDSNTAALLSAYLAERQLDSPGRDDHPVFFNQHRSKLSRGGVTWILRKYQAQATDPALAAARLSPHVLRHSRAMHLYDAGVPLPYIRDILGHVDLSTTEIYARASTEDLRSCLHRGKTQSSRSRVRRRRHRRPSRMEPKPRTARLARQPLIRPDYAQRPIAATVPTSTNARTLSIAQRCS